MTSLIQCKLYLPLRGEIRRIAISAQTKYQDLVNLFSGLQNLRFEDTQRLQLLYLDDENDWVSINSTHEWNEAVLLYQKKFAPKNGILKIKGM